VLARTNLGGMTLLQMAKRQQNTLNRRIERCIRKESAVITGSSSCIPNASAIVGAVDDDDFRLSL
jgi:hypothetical protein